jgi:hypothetical protein
VSLLGECSAKSGAQASPLRGPGGRSCSPGQGARAAPCTLPGAGKGYSRAQAWPAAGKKLSALRHYPPPIRSPGGVGWGGRGAWGGGPWPSSPMESPYEMRAPGAPLMRGGPFAAPRCARHGSLAARPCRKRGRAGRRQRGLMPSCSRRSGPVATMPWAAARTAAPALLGWMPSLPRPRPPRPEPVGASSSSIAAVVALLAMAAWASHPRTPPSAPEANVCSVGAGVLPGKHGQLEDRVLFLCEKKAARPPRPGPCVPLYLCSGRVQSVHGQTQIVFVRV